MLADDPEAPTTIKKRFDYPPLTGGKVTGSVVLDPDSIESLDPRVPATAAAAAPAPAGVELPGHGAAALGHRQLARRDGPAARLLLPRDRRAGRPPRPRASTPRAPRCPASPCTSSSAAPPNYAWSLTSAGHDVRDVFAERSASPTARRRRRVSTHYVYKGECRAFEPVRRRRPERDPPIYLPGPVHGPVFATATVDGKPYALSRQRSTFGRDALNLAALKDMTEGKASDARGASGTPPTSSASPSTGPTPRATRRRTSPPACCRGEPAASTAACRRSARASTSGRASSASDEHPHDVGGPDGLLLNWNNQSAPGFMHGDDEPYGSVQRVELFDQWPKRAQITDNVGIMNRAATEDVRSPVWPVVSQGASRRPGAERARRSRSSTSSTTGSAATRRASTPTSTGSTTSPGRRSWTRPGGRSPTP